MNRELVSIIINNYNYARFLRQAIESALAQTYSNTELIIVDDGSTDGSAELLEEFAGRAVVIRKTNGGQASAFNAGIPHAQGKFVLLLDADDYIFPETISECVSAFPKGYSRIYFRLRNVDRNGSSLVVEVPTNKFLPMDGYPARIAMKDGLIYWGPPTTGNFFDTEILKSILPLPEKAYRICADAFIVARTSIKGPVKSIDKELGAYRLHGENYFSAASHYLADPAKVRVQLDNFHLTSALQVEVCEALGVPLEIRAIDSSFWLLELLIAGYVWQVYGISSERPERKELVLRTLDYLRHGEHSKIGRACRALYLSCLLSMPKAASRWLLIRVDAWRSRKAAVGK